MPGIRLVGLILLAALACGAVACGGHAPAASPSRAPSGIVLLCVDTLRRDAVAPVGESPGRLPSLERVARDGVTFADATAAAPWTGPSVASLLTGLLPSHHGLDVGFDETAGRSLSPALTTLAEALRAGGWFTAACTGGAWVSPAQGVGQGFEYFSPDFDLRDPAAFLSEWQERRPKDRPFFLFLHTFGPHDPYGDKSVYFEGRCPDPTDALRLADQVGEMLEQGQEIGPALFADTVRVRWADPCGRMAFEHRLGPQRLRTLLKDSLAWAQAGWRADPVVGTRLARDLRSAYEAGLEATDRRLARTFQWLHDAGLPKDTWVVVAGDHGEAFGEGGHVHHGQSLHDVVIRVPLVVVAPDRLPRGAVVSGGCGLVDVMPTLLDAAGVAPPAGLDGRSLLALARGEEGGRPMVAEGHRAAVGGLPEAAIVSVRVPAAKWVLEHDPASGATLRESLFDLAEDPAEERPIDLTRVRSFGADFCRVVTAVRNQVRARSGLQPLPPVCDVLH